MIRNELVNLRDTWEFSYTTAQVLAAAQKMEQHHKSRLDWWEQEKKTAEVRLKEKGFEYREERRSMGPNVVIVGDPQLANRVTECQEKIHEHRNIVRSFESWIRALSGKEEQEPGSTLLLKIQDIVFFGL